MMAVERLTAIMRGKPVTSRGRGEARVARWGEPWRGPPTFSTVERSIPGGSDGSKTLFSDDAVDHPPSLGSNMPIGGYETGEQAARRGLST